MERHLVFQAYGSEDIINEFRYCIHSIYKTYNHRPPFSVTVYTDKSAFLKNLLPPEVNYRELNNEILREWSGEYNFVHRVKVKMLQDFRSSVQGSVLYMDTDTMLTGMIDSLFDAVKNGSYVMHVREGIISSRMNLIFKKIDKFLVHNPDMGIPPNVALWNAGVLGFLTSDEELLPAVLTKTDRLFAAYQKHIMEQLAFSFCMAERKEVLPADNVIYHYWNFKEFRSVLRNFFSHYADASFAGITAKTGNIDPRVLIQPKLAFEKQPSIIRSIKKLTGNQWSVPDYKLD